MRTRRMATYWVSRLIRTRLLFRRQKTCYETDSVWGTPVGALNIRPILSVSNERQIRLPYAHAHDFLPKSLKSEQIISSGT